MNNYPKATFCLFALLPSSAFSAVVLELGSDSLIDTVDIGATRSTLNAQGTLVDPSAPMVPLSTVTFSIAPETGVPVPTPPSTTGDGIFYDNGSSSHFENNSTPRWSSGNFENVDGTSLSNALDALGLRQTGVAGVKGVMTITFSPPVTDLALHLWNLDTGDILLTSVNGSTTDFTGEMLSGNLGAGLDGTILNPGARFNAGNGSVTLTPTGGGPVSSIGLTIEKDAGPTDGYSLFLSGNSVVPEPSSALLSGFALFSLLRRRRQ